MNRRTPFEQVVQGMTLLQNGYITVGQMEKILAAVEDKNTVLIICTEHPSDSARDEADGQFSPLAVEEGVLEAHYFPYPTGPESPHGEAFFNPESVPVEINDLVYPALILHPHRYAG